MEIHRGPQIIRISSLWPSNLVFRRRPWPKFAGSETYPFFRPLNSKASSVDSKLTLYFWKNILFVLAASSLENCISVATLGRWCILPVGRILPETPKRQHGSTFNDLFSPRSVKVTVLCDHRVLKLGSGWSGCSGAIPPRSPQSLGPKRSEPLNSKPRFRLGVDITVLKTISKAFWKEHEEFQCY